MFKGRQDCGDKPAKWHDLHGTVSVGWTLDGNSVDPRSILAS